MADDRWTRPRSAGDLPAFELLMRQYERLVLVTAFRLAGNLPDAQDVSQEVFLKLYRNLGKLASEDAVASWLYRVTVNACHDLRRRRRPEDPMEHERRSWPPGAADPHQALAESERSRALELSLRMLPEKERAALVLRDLEGLSTEEVARALGLQRGHGAVADLQGAGEGEGFCGAVFREAVMNCVEWEARVALHAGGDLAGAEAAEVERHLGECSACQVLWSGVRESLAVLQAAHAELPAAAHFTAVRARVMAELEAAGAALAEARLDFRPRRRMRRRCCCWLLLARRRGSCGAAHIGADSAGAWWWRAGAGRFARSSGKRQWRTVPLQRAADHQVADGGPEHRHLLDCRLVQGEEDETNRFCGQYCWPRRSWRKHRLRMARVNKLLTLKNVDPKAVAAMFNQWGVSIVPISQHKDPLDFRAPGQGRRGGSGHQTTRRGPKTIELTVYFVVGGDQPNLMGGAVPQDLRDVITQLKGAFTFKDYKMLDALTLRTRAGSSADTSGILNAANPPRMSQFSIRNATVSEDGTTIRIDRMHAGLRIPYTRREGVGTDAKGACQRARSPSSTSIPESIRTWT